MKRTAAVWMAAVLWVWLLSAGAQTSAPAKSAPLPQASPSYVIGADDTLYISVWKEPDLTNTLPVRADGMISADPHVTVVVTAMTSQRIYCMGEVLHPGAMNLLPDMTVLQALATAGFTQFANTKGIYVLRNENSEQKKIPVNYRKLVKGQGMDQNLTLKPGDTIVVP